MAQQIARQHFRHIGSAPAPGVLRPAKPHRPELPGTCGPTIPLRIVAIRLLGYSPIRSLFGAHFRHTSDVFAPRADPCIFESRR